jgi:hypothetical protein
MVSKQRPMVSERVVLEGFMILGLCMVKVHMNFLKDIVWLRSLIQVFFLV